EVVRQDATGAVGLAGDGPDGGAGDAVTRDHPPGSGQDLVPPGVPVDDLRHNAPDVFNVAPVFLSDVRLISEISVSQRLRRASSGSRAARQLQRTPAWREVGRRERREL